MVAPGKTKVIGKWTGGKFIPAKGVSQQTAAKIISSKPKSTASPPPVPKVQTKYGVKYGSVEIGKMYPGETPAEKAQGGKYIPKYGITGAPLSPAYLQNIAERSQQEKVGVSEGEAYTVSKFPTAFGGGIITPYGAAVGKPPSEYYVRESGTVEKPSMKVDVVEEKKVSDQLGILAKPKVQAVEEKEIPDYVSLGERVVKEREGREGLGFTPYTPKVISTPKEMYTSGVSFGLSKELGEIAVKDIQEKFYAIGTGSDVPLKIGDIPIVTVRSEFFVPARLEEEYSYYNKYLESELSGEDLKKAKAVLQSEKEASLQEFYTRRNVASFVGGVGIGLGATYFGGAKVLPELIGRGTSYLGGLGTSIGIEKVGTNIEKRLLWETNIETGEKIAPKGWTIPGAVINVASIGAGIYVGGKLYKYGEKLSGKYLTGIETPKAFFTGERDIAQKGDEIVSGAKGEVKVIGGYGQFTEPSEYKVVSKLEKTSEMKTVGGTGFSIKGGRGGRTTVGVVETSTTKMLETKGGVSLEGKILTGEDVKITYPMEEITTTAAYEKFAAKVEEKVSVSLGGKKVTFFKPTARSGVTEFTQRMGIEEQFPVDKGTYYYGSSEAEGIMKSAKGVYFGKEEGLGINLGDIKAPAIKSYIKIVGEIPKGTGIASKMISKASEFSLMERFRAVVIDTQDSFREGLSFKSVGGVQVSKEMLSKSLTQLSSKFSAIASTEVQQQQIGVRNIGFLAGFSAAPISMLKEVETPKMSFAALQKQEPKIVSLQQQKMSLVNLQKPKQKIGLISKSIQIPIQEQKFVATPITARSQEYFGRQMLIEKQITMQKQGLELTPKSIQAQMSIQEPVMAQVTGFAYPTLATPRIPTMPTPTTFAPPFTGGGDLNPFGGRISKFRGFRAFRRRNPIASAEKAFARALGLSKIRRRRKKKK